MDAKWEESTVEISNIFFLIWNSLEKKIPYNYCLKKLNAVSVAGVGYTIFSSTLSKRKKCSTEQNKGKTTTECTLILKDHE